MNRKNPFIAAAATSVALSVTASASAEQVLEEIVVTATKRAESLQDVPLSILAFNGPAMKEGAITKLEDLTQNMPAVTVAQNPIGNAIFIRGIGSSTNQGIEQSVAIFHDSIFLGRHQLSRAPFMDLERVEVVRGPQSIMFGKNTIGGALSVITAGPTEEFEGNVGVLAGEYGEQEVNLVLSGPLTDRLSGRLAVCDYQHDGYMDNVMNGRDEPGRDDLTARGTLRWDATDNLTVTAKYERSEFKQDGSLVQLAVLNPLTPGAQAVNALNAALVGLAGGAPESYDDEPAVINDGGELVGLVVPPLAGLPGFPGLAEGSDNEMDTAALTIDWGLGDHTLTAVTGYAGYEYRDICDCDFAALPLIQVDATEDYEQITQEVRLTSPRGETLDYIVGLYYHNADLYYTSDESFGTALLAPASPPPNVTRSYFLDQEQEQWAVFGSFTNSPCWAREAVADPAGCLDGKNVSGQSSQYAPDFSANLKLDHYWPLTGSLELHSTLNVSYSDGYFNASDLDPVIAYQDSWTKYDIRFALRPISDRWEIALLGKNLTDEKTSGNSNDQPLVPGNGFAQLDRLRAITVQGTL